MKTILFLTLALGILFAPIPLNAEAEPRPYEFNLPSDLTVPPLSIEVAESLNVEDVTRLALAENLDIKIARLDLKRARKDLPIAKSVYDTMFTVDATYSQDFQQRASVLLGQREIEGQLEGSLEKKLPTGTIITLTGNGARHSTTNAFTSLDRTHTGLMEVAVEQPILKNFFGILDRREIKKVKLDVRKFDYETLDSIEESLAEVRNQYWSLVFEYQNLEKSRKDLKRAQEFLEITTKKMDLGTTEKPDLYAAESNVRQRVIAVLRAEKRLFAASYALKVLLNIEDVELIIPTDQPIFSSINLDLKAEKQRALETRRDLKAFQLELEKQHIEVKIKSNERLPDLTFTGSYGTTGLDRKLSASQGKIYAFERPQYAAGINFSLPIENRDARARHKQEKFNLEKLAKEYRQLELRIGQEVDDAIRELKLASERVKQTEEIQHLETQKLKEEQKNFNVGRSDSKTIIDFQDDVVFAETEAILALVDYAKAVENYHEITDQLIEKSGMTEEDEVAVAS